MSFEYFNTSHLAFGSKLTKAFKQLEKMCIDGENNIAGFVEDVEYLGEYVNRNYRVPRPTSETSAVRVDDIIDVINDNYYIKEATYKDGIFRLSINFFNKAINRMTIASGSTDIRDGYAYFKSSISNSDPASEIKFVEKKDDTLGNLLFKYRIDSKNVINIQDGTSSVITFKVGNMDKINSISFGDSVTLPYTATDYCCVAVIGRLTGASQAPTSVQVVLNGNEILTSKGGFHKNTAFVYLKPDDVLSSNVYDHARFVDYNITE